MVLELEEKLGEKIQASVMNRTLFNKFDTHPVEGQTYFIANMELIPNGKDYKATNHQFKLLFNAATYVEQQDAAIPLFVFNFFPIKDIITQTFENHTMSLFDIIAFVLNIDPLEEYYSGTEKKTKLRLTLADEKGNIVPMVLFDDCASNFASQQFPPTQKPTVLLAELARIGFDEDGRPEVCSSFNATKIHLNAEFKEVADFISSAQHIPSAILTSPNPSVGSQTSTTVAESILKNTPTIKIVEICLQEVGQSFAVICEIKKFLTRDGWCYEGCARCGTKSNLSNGVATYSSYYCKGKKCTIQPKLRLNYLIADDSGTASVVFFDKHAAELLKKSAAQLKSEIPQDQMSFAFPKEVDILLGKRMILKLKLNTYNKSHPTSSVSVSTYAEATDLNNAFDEAVAEVPQSSVVCDDDAEEIIIMRNCTAKHKAITTAEPNPSQAESISTIDLTDISISDDLNLLPSKGKRKVSSKRGSAVGVSTPTYGPSSPAKTSSKTLKSIKQEKN